MAGYPDFNRPLFKLADRFLTEWGYITLNPASGGLREGWTWREYLRYDINLLIQSDGVATIGSWQESKGANIEVRLAHELAIPVLPYEAWRYTPLRPDSETRRADKYAYHE